MTPGETPRIRLLLADDHALVRSGLRMPVESRDGIVVVAEARRAAEAMDRHKMNIWMYKKCPDPERTCEGADAWQVLNELI